MRSLSKIWTKIRRKWAKIRLQPIRVFCFHHVSAEFDAESMHACDWMQIDEFKSKVLDLQHSGVEFISLKDAYEHISNEYFRRKKYAVLTFDDGWETLKYIIPWLCKHNIKVLLFVNPSYLLGEDQREKGKALTISEFNTLLEEGRGNIYVASHGWNHKFCSEMTMSEFENNVEKCELFFSKYNQYIPFFAYPCGKHTAHCNQYLLSRGITPVLMDGEKNYYDTFVIHRELLD